MISIAGGQLTLINVSLELDLSRDVAADTWALFETRHAELVRLENCWLTINNAGAATLDDLQLSRGAGTSRNASIALRRCVTSPRTAFAKSSHWTVRSSALPGLPLVSPRNTTCEPEWRTATSPSSSPTFVAGSYLRCFVVT
jgi:hypothetical protein